MRFINFNSVVGLALMILVLVASYKAYQEVPELREYMDNGFWAVFYVFCIPQICFCAGATLFVDGISKTSEKREGEANSQITENAETT